MFVRLKKPKDFEGIFLDPNALHKVYLKDEMHPSIYYMLKSTGYRRNTQIGSKAGSPATVHYISDDCPEWDKNGQLIGYTHVTSNEIQEELLDPQDNEESYFLLRKEEEFYA